MLNTFSDIEQLRYCHIHRLTAYMTQSGHISISAAFVFIQSW